MTGQDRTDLNKAGDWTGIKERTGQGIPIKTIHDRQRRQGRTARQDTAGKAYLEVGQDRQTDRQHMIN